MKIKSTIWKTGSGTAVVTIPKTHIESGNLKVGEDITFEIKEEVAESEEKQD